MLIWQYISSNGADLPEEFEDNNRYNAPKNWKSSTSIGQVC